MDYLIIVEKQLGYAKNVLQGRKDQFRESFVTPLFEGEQTAAEVYIHGLTPLYKYSTKILNPEVNESTINLVLNSELPDHEQYIDLYEQIIRILRDIDEKMTEDELQEHITYPFNPDITISILEWIGLNIMHAVTHVGQALRLQSLYIRNKIQK